jgi:hypothetical protein
MKRLLVTTALAAATMAGSALAPAGARADPTRSSEDVRVAQLTIGLNVYGGRNYCWYDDAWSGPGWYWCNYEWRNGFGWGGGYGWNSWSGGHTAGYYSGRGNSGRGLSNLSYRAGSHSSAGYAHVSHTRAAYSSSRSNAGHSFGSRSSGGNFSGSHSGGGHFSGRPSGGGHAVSAPSGGGHRPH